MPLARPDPAARACAVEPVEHTSQVAAIEVLPRVARFQEHEATVGQADPAILADLDGIGDAGRFGEHAVDFAARSAAVGVAEHQVGALIELAKGARARTVGDAAKRGGRRRCRRPLRHLTGSGRIAQTAWVRDQAVKDLGPGQPLIGPAWQPRLELGRAGEDPILVEVEHRIERVDQQGTLARCQPADPRPSVPGRPQG